MLAGHSRGLARHHDCGRRDPFLAGLHTDQGETASCLQAQHRRADCIRLRGAGHGRLWLLVADGDTGPHGAGRGFDASVGCRLCRRMGAAYQLNGRQVVSPRNPSRLRGGAATDPALVHRQLLFWLAGLLLFVLMPWLLSEIMLPFVAGLAIAYLLTPLTDRLERLGVSRLAAALLIITIVVLALIYLILLGGTHSCRTVIVVLRECSVLLPQ